jgi:hypothetical protein
VTPSRSLSLGRAVTSALLLAAPAAPAGAVAARQHGTTATASLPASGVPSASLPTRKQVRRALLTRADLPAGYQVDRSTSTDAPSTSTSSDPACSSKLAEMESATGAKASRSAGVAFQADAVGPFVSHAIGVWRTKAPAAAGMSAMRSLLRACDRWTETEKDGSQLTFRLARQPFPKLGTERVALRLTVTARGTISMSVRADVVAVRVRNAVSLLTVTRLPGTGTVTLAPLVRVSTARLKNLV